MNSRLIFVAALTVGSAFATYTYDYSQSPVISDATRWSTNGTAAFNSHDLRSQFRRLRNQHHARHYPELGNLYSLFSDRLRQR